MDETTRLKTYIGKMEEELKDLRAFKQQNIELKHVPQRSFEEQSAFTSKFLEMSKKNRNMTAEIESLKSKIKKVVAENENVRNQLEMTNKDVEHNERRPTAVKSEEVLLNSQQLTHVTNKMIEYRRQCHQMKIDIRHLTKALCQEIGDGVNLQTLPTCINSNNWRGRQQQIISLQQKVSDLQAKFNNCQCQSTKLYSHDVGAGEGYVHLDSEDSNGLRMRGSCEDVTFPRLDSAMYSKNCMSKRPFVSLHQQELKKYDQIQKLTADLNESKSEIEFLKNEAKASKARNNILDAQVKSFRFQITTSTTQLQYKQDELTNTLNELKLLRLELKKVQSREMDSRGQNCTELHELQRLLSKERAMVNNLQKTINENQETLRTLDKEKFELQQKLDKIALNSEGAFVSSDEIKRKILSIENQLSQAAKVIETSEAEHKTLLNVIKESAKELDEERGRTITIQLRLSKAFAVLERADACILQCMEGAQVCDEDILMQVEDTRALIRELKIGELISLEHTTGTRYSDAKNLSTQVSMLKKEIVVLRDHLQKTLADKRKDLKSFTIVAEEIRREYSSYFPIAKYLNMNKEEN